MKKKLCVIGLGYIGLPTSVIFAQNNWEVTGVDINENAVEMLNKGKVHIKEDGLDEVLEKVVQEKMFVASTSPVEADAYIIAVSTPQHKDNTANLNNVKSAVNVILPVLKKGNTIILESTVPPRTTRDIIVPILESAGFIPGQDIYLSYCPERVLPGKILTELIENNRIIGGINEISAKKSSEIYKTFVKGKVIETTAESAEMSKLMENTYRDVNIALANELTKISENLNLNPLEIITLANEHPRVNIHQPGPGVGGHCIAVDPYFIIEKDKHNTKLIQSARKINESMPKYTIEQVEKLANKSSIISIFGLAFKGNVDDIRNSPSFEIYDILISKGYTVKVYDPYVKQEQVNITLSTKEESINNTDIILILTDHDKFKEMDWNSTRNIKDKTIIMDFKSCINQEIFTKDYYDFGNLYNIKEKMPLN